VPDGYRIVHLDNDPWQLGKNVPTASAILGDPLHALPALTAALESAMGPADRTRREARMTAVKAAIAADFCALHARARAEAGRSPISPLALMQALGETLPPEGVVVDESISSGAGLFQFLQNAPPGSLFGLRGGGIGWGLPAAIGIQLALPDRRVVALVGDGSAMYSIQALWTAAHEKVPVIFVILNNGAYRILKQRLAARQGVAAQRGRYVGMELSEPAICFTGLAAAMGVPAVSVATIPEFVDALKLGLKSEHPLLIDVCTDPTFR
jgi:benzoylformate decarboxylase